ncbi:hypothetical protein [Clostridium sp. MD294]|uniref:hypothetical protein n=1 Tax=Clostridium sp. MD294 TaxID=97138 RepID=UPI0002C95C06|nr:hypothetical protein [Clostridium sp. MD294]NDO45330.1 hypothetical protein [Clostridium sp. MD294]USF31029.1 hypothetical protein C820_002475 [Clostridium sp. MD294]
MKKLKKIISMLLLCSMIFTQPIYAVENPIVSEPSQSGNEYFAEKDHILYYFKYVKLEEIEEEYNSKKLQLYQYNLQTETESLLCEDFFEDLFGSSHHIRVCNDEYIYFYGKKVDDDREGYYRVSKNGGKSEYYGSSIKITFLSDKWVYDREKNVFYNFETQEIIKNTIQDLYRIAGSYINFLEYHDMLYIHVNLPFSLQNDEKQDVNRINGQQLENGVYVVSLYKQNDFHRIENDDDIYLQCAYHNNLYYSKENQIKEYSLKNHTVKTIIKKEEGVLNMLNIYNDILYYYYDVEKNGKHYSNIYGISLKEENQQPFLAAPYIYGYAVDILEDVTFYAANIGRWYIGNWRIYDIHTGKRYFIEPY